MTISLAYVLCSWFKLILWVNTKGSGMANATCYVLILIVIESYQIIDSSTVCYWLIV